MWGVLPNERMGLQFTRTIASGPCQSLSGLSPAELATTFQCFIWDSLNLEGQVLVFLSPRNRVAKVISPGTGLLISCIPQTSQRWQATWCIASARIAEKTRFPKFYCCEDDFRQLPSNGHYLLSHYLLTVYSCLLSGRCLAPCVQVTLSCLNNCSY
jgi:hypothetical protein